jgi:hypothetical protein
MPRVAADEPNYPYPARFWWLKRLAALGLALFISLTLVRLAWGRHMAGRLATAEAAVRSRGGAVTVEDLNRPSVIPQAANAATYFKQAMAALRPVYGPSSSSLYWAEYPPYSPAWQRLADAALRANRPAFTLARNARPFPRADWGVRYTSPLLMRPTTALNTSRELANQLADAALYEHVQGDDAAALEYARDVLHLSCSLDQETTLIDHLVAIGVEAIALQRLMIIAPALQVQRGDDITTGTSPPGGAARRGQVEALVRDLLDAPAPGERTASTLQGAEVVMLRDTLRWHTRSNWVVAPAFDGLEHQALSSAEAYAGAATQPTAALASAAIPHPPAGGNAMLPRASAAAAGPTAKSDGVLAAWFGGIRVNYSAVIEQDMRVLAERRMAAVSLAARLYRIDHAGQWPRTLDELVPKYLPAVPRDPFRADGGPLSYLVTKNPADGAERPVVYHVSSDGVDETPPNGSTLPPEPTYSWTSSRTPGRPNAPDQWRDLSRFVPAKSATTNDADGDGVPDDEQPGGAPTAPTDDDATSRPAGNTRDTSTP